MKAACVFLPVAVLLWGCNDAGQSTEKSPRDGSIANAPAEYVNSMGQAQKTATKTIDVAAINKAVEAFYVQEGRFPKALAELEDKGFMRAIPQPPPGMKLNYDTNSGVVTMQKDPGNQ